MPEMKLQLVPIPVADVDLAKAFYIEKLGFHTDHDVRPSDTMRVCQLTPPGSACSILLGTGLGPITNMVPGSLKGLHLVVPDAASAREDLLANGVEAGEMVEYPGGIKMVPFSDPDGNMWLLQEVPSSIA